MSAPAAEIVPAARPTRRRVRAIHGTPALLDDTRWQATREAPRYRKADHPGTPPYVIAVESTGICCRPGCPAKSPHRHNVAFYDDAATARADGFRACLRCHPDA